jgi:hypothetical protein
MSENNESKVKDLKGCVVFACGLNPHEIVRFESINTVITRLKGEDGNVRGQALPALQTKASMGAGKEYNVDFPIFTIDVDSLEALEKVRDLLKERLDRSFSAYIEKWDEIQAKNAKMQNVHKTIRDTIGKASKNQENKDGETGNVTKPEE